MADEPTTTPPEGGKDDGDKPDQKTLTQEQVDKIVQDRLARDREAREKEAEAERQKLEDEKKSEAQKLLDRIAAAEKRAEEAESSVKKSQLESLRLRVATAKGLTEKQAARLRGESQEELEADADDLLESFGGTKKKGDDESGESQTDGRPKEKLRPGASNDDDQEPDYKAIAEKVLNKNKI